MTWPTISLPKDPELEEKYFHELEEDIIQIEKDAWIFANKELTKHFATCDQRQLKDLVLYAIVDYHQKCLGIAVVKLVHFILKKLVA